MSSFQGRPDKREVPLEYLVLPCRPMRVAWSRSVATRVFRRAKKKAAAKRGSLGRMRSYSRGTDSGLREREGANFREFGFTVGSKIVNRWFCFLVRWQYYTSMWKDTSQLGHYYKNIKGLGCAQRDCVHAQTISI